MVYRATPPVWSANRGVSNSSSFGDKGGHAEGRVGQPPVAVTVDPADTAPCRRLEDQIPEEERGRHPPEQRHSRSVLARRHGSVTCFRPPTSVANVSSRPASSVVGSRSAASAPSSTMPTRVHSCSTTSMKCVERNRVLPASQYSLRRFVVSRTVHRSAPAATAGQKLSSAPSSYAGYVRTHQGVS